MFACCAAVDEGTCMTPQTPSTIKAFYVEDAAVADVAVAGDADTASAAAAVAAEPEHGSSGGRVSVASSSSAFEVLQFQIAEPEQQVRQGCGCLARSTVSLCWLLQQCRLAHSAMPVIQVSAFI
jgi:hypothetical protein